MAFVVIMHLSPKHESHAASLLQATTEMPVMQVTEAVKVEPNHVYVIPPTKNLEMNDGQIIVKDPQRLSEGKQVAIDRFFRTLAETHKENAVGIVLSGMGSDGTNGLKRIKEHNGLAFAQDPKEAEHDSMPRHAIGSNLVDFVLPVAEIPAKLIEIRRNASRIMLPPETEPPPVVSRKDEDEEALRDIFNLLRSHTGHDFSHYKRVTVLRRIARRMQVNQLHQLTAYREFMRANPLEAQALLKDLLISVTNFFRDRNAFEALQREVMDQIFHAKTTGDQVRVWVAGCATGEEAYSVAILLLEYADRLPSPPSIQIFATDIDEAAIQTAREGYYTDTIEADVSQARLGRFFTKANGGYRIKKEVRERVLFAVHNLIKDPPFSRLDAITCRNLLIYLNREAQQHIVGLFHFVLLTNGFLFLGNSESVGSENKLFTPVDKKQRIYRAEDVPRRAARVPMLPLDLPQQQASAPQRELTREPQWISLSALHQKLLEQYAPPNVIIDKDYKILYSSGEVERFLRFASGEPSHILLKVVRPELRIELRTALFQAAKTGKSFEARRVKIDRDDRDSYVSMIVRPVPDQTAGVERDYFLIFFDEVEGLTNVESSGPRNSEAGSAFAVLEEELQITKEQQQAAIEQYETQTEELKASNEELQAMNEELRSASEELETGKEELQSVNEEIQTINVELKQKIDELAVANSDLQNLIISTDVATIFVDRDFKIKFYTPRAQDIFSLIPTDVGRPLSDITHKLDYVSMLQDMRQVLESGHRTEVEVKSCQGLWYIAVLLPYRLRGEETDGVILTFIDFTRRKEAENETQAAREGLERHTVSLMEINEALQTEVSERQRVERERGQLLRRIVFAQEEERARIAREMHDQFGQQLTVLKLKLDALKKDCVNETNLCDQVETLQALAQQLDADVDSLVWEMRPMALDDLGLEAALTSYVQNWSTHLGIPVDLHSTAIDRSRLSIDIETVLYRIAQEALNNVAKHAQATNVAIVLEQRANQLLLIVEDNGAGFDLQAVLQADEKGLGLIGMRERAALVAGTIEIESQPNSGTTIVVKIPVPKQAEEHRTHE